MISQKEIDEKIDQETKKINFVDWATRLLVTGVLWATYEKLGKPVGPGLLALSLAKIDQDHVYGRRKVSGVLAQVENIDDVLPFRKEQIELLKLSLASAGNNLREISDHAKSQIKRVLIDSQVTKMGPRELEKRLRETFKGIDRDWRKVTVTESASTAINGYLFTQGDGQQVVVQSAADCCDWCREMLHGKIFTVLHKAPDPANTKLWETALWPGKSNVGRSRHKKARGGVSRSASQLWMPCCPLHPSCRCRPVVFDSRHQEIGRDGYIVLKREAAKS